VLAKTPPRKINIRPGVSVLSVLRHLNYRPWFALAEFVDNAVQSYQLNEAALRKSSGANYHLRVNIDLDATEVGRIVVRDNAAGIAEKDFPRAFRPAAIPPDTSGLSEFGMGMKSAACWFAPEWYVRTSALGEPTEKKISFNIAKIVRDELEELSVQVTPADPKSHFTEIVLVRPYKLPAGKTLAKIKEHLADIYRVFTRESSLVLKVDGQVLEYEEPDVLVAPSYKDEDGPDIGWRTDIDLDFGRGLTAKGFAAIRKVGSTSKAGFALFRRGRLIQGSGDEGYRPPLIFGKPNSFVYQRLFGELHLEGFEVSHTKDGFQWDDNEEPFLQELKTALSDPKMPLLQQAREYRVAVAREELHEAAEAAASRTAKSMENHLADAIEVASETPVEDTPPTALPKAESTARKVVDLELEDRRWRVVLELSQDHSVGDLFEVSQSIARGHTSEGRDLLGVRVSVVHPFMQRYVGSDEEKLEIVVRLAAGLAVAEKLAREAGGKAGAVRDRLNLVMRDALSKP
jgi:hypothetical protein